MKRKVMAGMAVLALVFGLALAGCENGNDNGGGGDEYAQYYEPTYRGNNNGTVEVINPSSFDMLLFKNNSLLKNSIIGGVHAMDTSKLTFSDESDFTVGGFKIIYAVKESEYKTAQGNSKIDYTAMVTYRSGSDFRVTIQSRFDGNYRYTVFNRNTDWPLELRKNSAIGEKIGFLAPGETWYEMKSPNATPFVIYPVWIAYNTLTRSIIPFCPKDDILSVQTIQALGEPNPPPPYYFPGGGTQTITFDIDLPFANIKVQNNSTLVAFFRSANAIQPSQEGIQGINSGYLYNFDVVSTPTGLDLNLAIGPAQNLQIPVRFEDDPATLPVVDNGWVYNVSLNRKPGVDGSQADHYTAWLVKGSQINQNDFLVAN